MLVNTRYPPQLLPGGCARERAGGAGRQGGRRAGDQDRHAHQVGQQLQLALAGQQLQLALAGQQLQLALAGQQLQLALAGQLSPRSCCRQLRTLEARLSADMRTIVELLEHHPAHTTTTVQQPPRSQSQPSDVTVSVSSI